MDRSLKGINPSPACKCGTGTYCKVHYSYGVVRGTKKTLRSHAALDQVCGGGKRRVRKGIALN